MFAKTGSRGGSSDIESRATSLEPLLPITLLSSGSSVPAFKAGIWHCAMLLNTSDRPLVIHICFMGNMNTSDKGSDIMGTIAPAYLKISIEKPNVTGQRRIYIMASPKGLSIIFFILQLNKIQLNKISISFSQARERAINKPQMLKRRC